MTTKRVGLIGAIGFVLGITPSSSAIADCPLTYGDCFGSSTESSGSRSCQDLEFGTERQDWNLTLGRIGINVRNINVGSSTSIQANDDYTVIGIPDGTPITVVARLAATGLITLCSGIPGGGGGSIRASVVQSETNQMEVGTSAGCSQTCCDPFSASFDSTAQVTVAAVAGQAFHLSLRARASVFRAMAGINAQLSFEGLPPGASVVSCHGYRQEFPVPASAATWGAMKRRYR